MLYHFQVFEYGIIARFSTFLVSSDNQFGFKIGSNCSLAIQIVKTVVDYYNKGGSTVNLFVLYLSKVFDKMDHNTLFVKLMERKLPVKRLCIIEIWFLSSITCLRWGSITTSFMKLSAGVRQGGAMSHCLFDIFICIVINEIICCDKGYSLASRCVSIILHADDILPSLQAFNPCL